MHCRISFFGDWHVPCKRLVRNEWKTWAAITPHSGFPSVRSPRILLSNVSASCTPWFGPAPSASEWSGDQRSRAKRGSPFRGRTEDSRVAFDVVGQLLGQASSSPQLSRLRWHCLSFHPRRRG